MTDISELPDSLPGLAFDDNSVDAEAQLVVSDFLDYTEYLPSDLIRSHTLIKQLSQSFDDAGARVHDLARQYAKAPSLPPTERPNLAELRKEISITLERAQNYRAASLAEAERIKDLVKKHKIRLGLIKTKLQALPKPASRDPTPEPSSPQLIKTGKQTLKLTVQEKRRQRKGLVLDNIPTTIGAEHDGQEDDHGISPRNVRGIRKPRSGRLPRVPKTPKARIPRTPGERRIGLDGKPLHHRVSTISTSNALAMLEKPPEDALPGSKWRPWLKLTEYELAVIRKGMKKNVQWVPSAAMIHRYLADHGRGLEKYQIEKAKAETSGKILLDEEPESKDLAALSGRTSPGMQLVSESQHIAADTVEGESDNHDDDEDIEMKDATVEETQPEDKAIVDYFSMGTRPRTRRTTQEAMPMDEVNKKTSEVLLSMRNIFDQPPTPAAVPEIVETIIETGRGTRKRKRGATRAPSAVSITSALSETFSPVQETKRLKVDKPIPLSLAPPKSPAESIASVRSMTRTKIVPLVAESVISPLSSATSGELKDKEVETIENASKPATPAFVQPTAAQYRSRRSSLSKESAPFREHSVQLELPRPSRASTRSGTSASAKAASAEPPPSKRELAERRRLSNNDQFSRSLPIVGPRSSRRKPPGLVTAEEGGRGKISIGRRKTKPKPKRTKKAGQTKDAEDDEDDENVDPDEPTYCTCEQVSYGTMVACDNEKCEIEWFHLDCVGLATSPRARQKWYCEACAANLQIDQEGNALPSHATNSRRR